MTRVQAWRASVIAGGIAFAGSLAFAMIPGLKPCGEAHGLGAILAFEFVRSPLDVATLFGAEPCRSTLVGAQGIGLLIDTFWFIPAYAAFLGFAAWATGMRWRGWLIAAIVVAALCDEIEGGLLYAILGGLPGTQEQIDPLSLAVHSKFALLALASLAIGWALCRGPAGRRWVPGAIVAAGGLYALVGLIVSHRQMMLGFGVAWTALLALAVVRTVFPQAYARFTAQPAAA